MTKTAWVVVWLLGILPTAGAAPLNAEEISQRAREQGGLNWVGLTVQLRLTTTRADGSTLQQELTTSSLKKEGRLYSLSRFRSPASVAGVAVLAVESRPGGASEMSLYFPKLKRVRKVAQQQRSQPFMETDFSFADLGNAEGETSFERREDSVWEGRPVYVLEGKGDAQSPYGKVKLSVDQDTFALVKAEYADKEGKPFKVFRALGLKKFKGRTIAASAVMENVAQGSKTVLDVLQLEEKVLGEESFTERALERG